MARGGGAILVPEDARVVRPSELATLLNGRSQRAVARELGVSASMLCRFLQAEADKPTRMPVADAVLPEVMEQ